MLIFFAKSSLYICIVFLGFGSLQRVKKDIPIRQKEKVEKLKRQQSQTKRVRYTRNFPFLTFFFSQFTSKYLLFFLFFDTFFKTFFILAIFYQTLDREFMLGILYCPSDFLFLFCHFFFNKSLILKDMFDPWFRGWD